MQNINDMSIVELKAICFDLDQQIKITQNQLSQVYMVLQHKIDEETKHKIEVNNELIL